MSWQAECDECGQKIGMPKREYPITCGDCMEGRTPLKRRVASLEAALREIAEDPHCTPDMHSPSRARDDQYRIGVADGHRCAAAKARAALAGVANE